MSGTTSFLLPLVQNWTVLDETRTDSSLWLLVSRSAVPVPRGGLRVLPAARVGADVLPAHGGHNRVLASSHQTLLARLLHLCADRSLRREGEAAFASLTTHFLHGLLFLRRPAVCFCTILFLYKPRDPRPRPTFRQKFRRHHHQCSTFLVIFACVSPVDDMQPPTLIATVESASPSLSPFPASRCISVPDGQTVSTKCGSISKNTRQSIGSCALTGSGIDLRAALGILRAPWKQCSMKDVFCSSASE